MQQVQWKLFYFEFTKTEDFDRTKGGYLVLVQYCDVNEHFNPNQNRPILKSKTIKAQTWSLGSSKALNYSIGSLSNRTVFLNCWDGISSRKFKASCFHPSLAPIIFTSVSTYNFISSRFVDLNQVSTG